MILGKKLHCLVGIAVIILYSICSYNVVSAYAVKYDEVNVGYIPINTSAQNEICTVESEVNSRIADGSIDINKKIKILPAYYPVTKTGNATDVAEKVLDITTKKKYCLYVDNKIYYTGETKQEVDNYIAYLNNYACDKYKTPEAIPTAVYSVKYENLLGEVQKYSDEYMVSLLEIKASKTVTETETEEIPYQTVKQYRDRRGITLQKGVPGTLEKQYSVTYVNDQIVKKEMVASNVLAEPVSKIVSTNVYAELPENTLAADASVLELDQEKTDFINVILPIAIGGYHETGILPSLTLAQAILESGFGKSAIGNNIYGIKAKSDWAGKKQLVWTKEQLEDGTYIDVQAYFKNYDSLTDSVKDYLTLLSGERYDKVRESHNYFDAACTVQESGYATSLAYSKNLVNIIEKYKLYLWDKVNAQIKHPEIIVPEIQESSSEISQSQTSQN